VDRLPGQGSRYSIQHLGLHEGDRSAITSLTPDAQADFSKKLVALVEKEGAGYKRITAMRQRARIWCGATVDAKDVALLTQ
jgi:phosphoserine aminotransferase